MLVELLEAENVQLEEQEVAARSAQVEESVLVALGHSWERESVSKVQELNELPLIYADDRCLQSWVSE